MATTNTPAGRLLDVDALTDDIYWEIGRRAIEDHLVEMRDASIGILGRGNGLVINSPDGTPSSIIRMTIEDALKTGIEAMASHQNETGPG